jgi:hypothetical protein
VIAPPPKMTRYFFRYGKSGRRFFIMQSNR